MAGLEQDFKALFDELKSLFSSHKPAPTAPATQTPAKSNADIPKGDGTYQAPVRGSWKSSGGFSMSATDARHPKGHMGVDLRAPGGTTLYPMADGVVTNVGTDPKGGNIVNVQHANGIRTYYAHLGTISVHKGDKVTKDTALGTIGDSGNAAGTHPHCHFQVWKDNQIQNPAQFFNVPAYQNATPDEKKWAPGAEAIAKNWSLRDHQSKAPRTAVASISEIDKLVKACDAYYQATRS